MFSRKDRLFMDKDKNRKGNPKTNEEIIDSYDYLSNAASMQDMTGLIPAEPVAPEELESYEELYHFLPPTIGPKDRKDKSHDW